MTTDTSSGQQKTDQMKEEGRQLKDEARSKGEKVGRQAKEEMGNVIGDARSKARDQADDQTHRAAGALRGMADQLNSMASGAGEEGMMVDLAQNGADRIRSFANHIDDSGIDGIVNDVENFARRRPGVFIAAGMGVGMVLGRVLRSADMESIKDAVSPDTEESETTRSDQSDLRPGSGPNRGPGDLGRRSEPLAPEEAPQPVTTRPEGPEAGRAI